MLGKLLGKGLTEDMVLRLLQLDYTLIHTIEFHLDKNLLKVFAHMVVKRGLKLNVE